MQNNADLISSCFTKRQAQSSQVSLEFVPSNSNIKLERFDDGRVVSQSEVTVGTHISNMKIPPPTDLVVCKREPHKAVVAQQRASPCKVFVTSKENRFNSSTTASPQKIFFRTTQNKLIRCTDPNVSGGIFSKNQVCVSSGIQTELISIASSKRRLLPSIALSQSSSNSRTQQLSTVSPHQLLPTPAITSHTSRVVTSSSCAPALVSHSPCCVSTVPHQPATPASVVSSHLTAAELTRQLVHSGGLRGAAQCAGAPSPMSTASSVWNVVDLATPVCLSSLSSAGNATKLSLSTFSPLGVRSRKPCNCTKSQCLKLYCDCFAAGEFCKNCNCTNCWNTLQHEDQRQKAVKACLDRNPLAFKPKIGKLDSETRKHQKGCNCKKSGCLKNYCECYEAKIYCSSQCKCCSCRNYINAQSQGDKRRVTNTPATSSSSWSALAALSSTDATSTAPGTFSAAPHGNTSSVQRVSAALQCLSPAVGWSSPDSCVTDTVCDTESSNSCIVITQRVLDASIRCLVARAFKSRAPSQSQTIEGDLLAEFGNVLSQIIDCSHKCLESSNHKI